MTYVRGILRYGGALLVGALFYVCAAPVQAGTTGAIGGVVIDAQSQAPVAGARVDVTSPSQIAHAVTDAHGRFTFVSLLPDTYTITVSKAGYLSLIHI